ncbi:MAG: ribose-5-phosphate isomerase RpiA [Nitriliruptorales bacterium]|nr:ribose-5-phosphate isomerase RpiA [Nitriliruptorales bacterium]
MTAAKEAAGRAAAEHVADGMRLGLGTGSTVAYFLEALAEQGVAVAGVPTSEATAARCRELGIDLLEPGQTERLDLCIDGADELTPDLALTKGGGGALLREKVVASMSERMIVIATPDKVVDRLGASFALPVEVVPFAVAPVARRCEQLGFAVTPRDGGAYRTDNGNAILDLQRDDGIDAPDELAAELAATPGVCEHGLFLGLADLALLGREDGSVEQLP